MPKLSVIERDGKLVVVSKTEAEGGPKDRFIAVKPNKEFISVEDRETALAFIADGGKAYMITHYWRTNDDGGEWLPRSYTIKTVGSD